MSAHPKAAQALALAGLIHGRVTELAEMFDELSQRMRELVDVDAQGGVDPSRTAHDGPEELFGIEMLQAFCGLGTAARDLSGFASTTFVMLNVAGQLREGTVFAAKAVAAIEAAKEARAANCVCRKCVELRRQVVARAAEIAAKES